MKATMSKTQGIMRNLMISIFYLFLISTMGFSQPVSYDDVGVIVNDNSEASLAIGAYFQQARNIPEQNMIHIQTITDEQIDTTEFRNIQYQIKNYILDQGLDETLNYLVTTKGVPFDIVVDSCTIGPPNTWSKCSSVQSELTLLFSADSNYIIQSGNFDNPYYQSAVPIDSSEVDIMLVTRLDGNTLDDVYTLIDRSGPDCYVDKELGQFVFDISYFADSIILRHFTKLLNPAIDTLTRRGWNAFLHSDSLVPSGLDHVISYVGCIFKSVQEPLSFTWERGSYAEMMFPIPDLTFYDSLNYYNVLQLAETIGEGCTGAAGYLHVIFAPNLTNYTVFFDRYTLPTKPAYTLAESYYMATKKLSWMNLLVGDPKTTITTEGGSSVNHPDALTDVQVYPNPVQDELNLILNSSTSSRYEVLLIDMMGNKVQQTTVFAPAQRKAFKLNVASLANGLYFISIRDLASGKARIEKVMVSHF